MNKLLLLLHFITASAITVVFACILQTQMVLLDLSSINVEISAADRLYMTYKDLIGLLPSYGVVITLGLAIAFGIATLIMAKTSLQSTYLYAIAGACAMAAILVAMQPILGVTLLAGARSASGIALQILSGFIGGYCFMGLREKSKQR